MGLQVVGVRVEQADAKHDHVALVGYHSPHLAQEPIMLSAERTIERSGIGDRFFIVVEGAEVDIVSGACPECGHTPYLRTKADAGDEQKLMEIQRR